MGTLWHNDSQSQARTFTGCWPLILLCKISQLGREGFASKGTESFQG